jgi:isochorismate synthase
VTTTATAARPLPHYRPDDLLAAYLPGSFYWSSGRGGLLADGVRQQVDGPPGARAAAAAAALHGLGDDPAAIVTGAIGFGAGAAASLTVPAVVRHAPRFAPAGLRPVPPPPITGPPAYVVQRPRPAGYADAVRRAAALIGSGRLTKVVLARGVEVTGEHPVEVSTLLRRLVAADPSAYAFAVDVSSGHDSATRTLIGASPELLVSRHGDVVTARPLAGSTARAADPEQDRAAAAGLLASEKDRHEHGLVVAQVAEVLGRFCTDLDVPTEPETTATATIWHLASRISGRVADGGHSALALAEALHPTPAVCGVPLGAARDAIGELEEAPRGYYSGLVGWTDARGDGEWAVTIRSAEVCDRTVTAFAGAGIVAGSDPEAELAETGVKLRTLLRALGVEAAL